MTDPGSLRTGEVTWLDLTSTDPQRSEAFYAELFGWRFESGPIDGYRIATRDGLVLAGLVAAEPGDPLDAWTVYLRADDLVRTYRTATDLGGTPYAAPTAIGDHAAGSVLADPTGAVFALLRPGTFRGLGEVGLPGYPAWFELHSTDATTSIRFHERVFGLETDAVADEPGFRYSTMRDAEGETVFGVVDLEGLVPAGTGSSWAVYFGSADVEADVARAIDLGGRAVLEPVDTPHGRVATLVDPCGAAFNLMRVDE
ncbi:VOC family protein [Pseudoclavibacter chungangensis]|uniref:VOC family protein n=1 Tax=Pseudoclavibacter chungangensis TaxID=587635 RepID=A0A7J5BUI4_9MICO|nr:VOC family protein [Pseudoclavibacter chungangensis]KAB1658009.1 VOC family protein [Pseudoclavibacter chungangensis]NYJ65827.1 hypothetical protein [Pseudoclavibacter chungangensis]